MPDVDHSPKIISTWLILWKRFYGAVDNKLCNPMLSKVLLFDNCMIKSAVWQNGNPAIDTLRVSKPSWWRHQMETFSVLLAICAGNSPASGEFPAKRPVTRSFDVFFDQCLNKWLRKQSWSWRFETLSRPLWCHCNAEPAMYDMYHL